MEHWKVWRPNPQDALHAAGPGPQAQVTAEAFSGMGPGRGGSPAAFAEVGRRSRPPGDLLGEPTRWASAPAALLYYFLV